MDGDTFVFPGFLTPVLTQLFFPKPPTTFLTMLLQRWLSDGIVGKGSWKMCVTSIIICFSCQISKIFFFFFGGGESTLLKEAIENNVANRENAQ